MTLLRQRPPFTVIQVARCPEHGLHGLRSECHECGGPVDQVELALAGDFDRLWDVMAEIKRQDAFHPSGYPCTRDGIRLGLAAAEDELIEALDAWRDGRCKCPEPNCQHHDWSKVRVEAIQAAAVLLRMASRIPIADGHMSTSRGQMSKAVAE